MINIINTTEIWKNIPNTDNKYSISSYGKLMSNKNKRILTLNPNKNRRNYLRKCLVINKKHINWRIHRLVAEAFILNLQNKPLVNHKDFNTQNNHISNLEWVTAKENFERLKKHGRYKKFFEEKNKRSKINNLIAGQIREDFKINSNKSLLSRKYNISRRTIIRVLNNESWLNRQNKEIIL